MRAEYEALTSGCGVVMREADRVAMTGPDRGRFLNGLVTCAVGELAPGTGIFGFVTSLKGRVLADLVVLAAQERFLLELPAGQGEAVGEHLLKYRIADRVELEPVAATVLTVAGPRAAEVLATAGAVVEAGETAWSHAPCEIGGAAVRRVRRGIGPGPAWDLWVDGDAAAVRAALTAAGAAPVGFDAWETLRVERGVPRFGAEYGADNFPQETGHPDAAVDYEKGCYLGQEVVARIHYRGGVNKGLVGLDLGAGDGDGSAPPAAGTPVLHDGRAAGHLGTAVRSPAFGRTLALVILHQRASKAGTLVEVEGVGTATVRELPFAAD